MFVVLLLLLLLLSAILPSLRLRFFLSFCVPTNWQWHECQEIFNLNKRAARRCKGKGKRVARRGRMKKTFDQDICRSFVRFFISTPFSCCCCCCLLIFPSFPSSSSRCHCIVVGALFDLWNEGQVPIKLCQDKKKRRKFSHKKKKDGTALLIDKFKQLLADTKRRQSPVEETPLPSDTMMSMSSSPPPTPTGVQTDAEGLILPKKLINPCIENTDRKELHRELKFNARM